MFQVTRPIRFIRWIGLNCFIGDPIVKSAVLFIDKVLTGLAMYVACLLLAVVSCLGMWQVLSRFVLSQPSIWTEEIMRRLLIWCVMLGVVVAIRHGAMVSVDLMLRVSKGVWKSIVRFVIWLSTSAFLATILWFGVSLSWRVRFQTFASMDVSMGWAYAALPAGAALGLIAVLAHYLDPINEELESAQ